VKKHTIVMFKTLLKHHNSFFLWTKGMYFGAMF